MVAIRAEKSASTRTTSLFKLNMRLEMARIRMVDAGMRYGLHDPRTVALSHKVDRIHVELERVRREA